MNEGGEAERVWSAVVTGNYFDVLGVRAERGRTFTLEEDETPNASPVVMVSHGLWQRRFGADPDMVGKTLTLGGQAFTVIGITPQDFTGTILGIAPELYVPVQLHARATGDIDLENRGNRSLFVMGRLNKGVGSQQAQAHLDAMARGLREKYLDQWTDVRGEGRRITVLPESEARIPPQIRPAALGVVGLLMGVVGLVLLIACANVANLLLARAAARRREIGIRIALGASRWRLMRQLLTESVMLAVLGGAAGMLVALWGIDLLTSYTPSSPVPLALNFAPDVRVLAFALGLSVLTGLIFGLAPALQATRSNVLPALKDESLTAGRVDRRFNLRNLLVIAQVAVSLVLLIGAGLFLRSLQNAQSIDPGFRPDNVLVITP